MNPLEYTLVKTSLLRMGCPEALQGKIRNQVRGLPIVAKSNELKLGLTAAGYAPAVIVTRGDATRRALLARGIVTSWAWIQNGAIEINADDAISCGELMDKLSNLMLEKMYGAARTPMVGQPWPSVVQVYPFENYLIYDWKGQKYRQGFALDPVERRVVLNGGSQAVKEAFVNAGDAKEAMPRVQTGVRYAWAPPMGNMQSTTRGAKNSELVTCIVRNWANINEAVSMYLSAIKNGLHRPMRPAFYPVPLSDDGKILAALSAKGVDAYDFAQWSAAAQQKKTKRVAGEDLPHSAFAYVGDKNDPSTWHLPVKFKDKAKSASHVRNALARVNQTKGIPQSAKAGVMSKLHTHAKHHGIDVQPKATPKQKAWLKKGVKSTYGTQPMRWFTSKDKKREMKSEFPGRFPSSGVARVGM